MWANRLEVFMDSLIAFLQVASALAIFAAAYLVALLIVVAGLVLTGCLYKVGSLARAYTVRTTSLLGNS